MVPNGSSHVLNVSLWFLLCPFRALPSSPQTCPFLPSQVSAPEDWFLDSPFLTHRQHHQEGNQEMLRQVALNFNLSQSADPQQQLRDTIYLTQVS